MQVLRDRFEELLSRMRAKNPLAPLLKRGFNNGDLETDDG